eukprot:15377-Heterococcus_DN1.PRE.8
MGCTKALCCARSLSFDAAQGLADAVQRGVQQLDKVFVHSTCSCSRFNRGLTCGIMIACGCPEALQRSTANATDGVSKRAGSYLTAKHWPRSAGAWRKYMFLAHWHSYSVASQLNLSRTASPIIRVVYARRALHSLLLSQ